MKLEGSLDAFSLPDIFQLLSYTKKTGGLRLQHAVAEGAVTGVVHFVDGAVTGATTGRGRQALARRVVGSGVVDRAALEAAVAAASEDGQGVVAALVAAGAVPADRVQQLVGDHIHDTVLELLRRPSGEFAFVPDEVNRDDVGVRLSPDAVVARATELRAAWDAAAALVPSPDAVAVLAGASDDVVVRPDEWAVLRLLDGRRRVSEVVELTGAGQLATVTALAGLVERGVVALRDDALPDVTGLLADLALLAPLDDAVPTGPPAPVATPPAPAADDAPGTADGGSPFEAPAPVPSRPEPTVVTLPDQAPAPARRPAAARVAEAPTDEPPVAAPAARAARPGPTSTAERLGGAHVPGDVVPPRPEPFRAARRPDFAESAPRVPTARGNPSGGGAVVGSSAVAAEQLVERDPNVNRSLLLRLIAGVRGL